MEIIDLLKAIGDNTRIRILNVLNDNEEYCVCDIKTILELTQSNASRHLNKLKAIKLINAKKKSQWVYYSLNREILEKYNFIKYLIEENLDNDIFKADLERKGEHLKSNNRCIVID